MTRWTTVMLSFSSVNSNFLTVLTLVVFPFSLLRPSHVRRMAIIVLRTPCRLFIGLLAQDWLINLDDLAIFSYSCVKLFKDNFVLHFVLFVLLSSPASANFNQLHCDSVMLVNFSELVIWQFKTKWSFLCLATLLEMPKWQSLYRFLWSIKNSHS